MRLAAGRSAVRLCPDEWMNALGIDLRDGPDRARVQALQWALVQEMLVAGVTVIIEWGVWARADRDRAQVRS
jgi:predicted kinase